MNILENLLQSAEEFYKRAMMSYRLIRMAAPSWQDVPEVTDEETQNENEENYDEGAVGRPPYFDDLVDISHKVGDPGLAKQLQILAELYERAIMMGGGFATVAKVINNLKLMYSDDQDSDIEDILNGMINELAKHAGGAKALAGQDNPKFIRSLQQLKEDIEARNSEQQNEAERDYQEEINVPGAQSEDIGEEAPNLSTFDPTAGIGGGKDGPTVNRGWHTVGRVGGQKDWVKYYKDEADAYKVDLENETNPQVNKVLGELVVLLQTISSQTKSALELNDRLKLENSPSIADKKQLADLITSLNQLKIIRTNLKRKIHTHRLSKEKQELEQEISKTRDPRIAELAKQKLALNELSSSKYLGKDKERNARLRLISMMSGGNFPSQKIIDEQLEVIRQAAESKIPWEKYYKEKQKEYIERRREDRNAGEILGLVSLLNIKLSDAVKTSKRAINNSLDKNKEKVYTTDPFFAKFINEVKEAVKASIIAPSPTTEARKSQAEMALNQALETYKAQQVAEAAKKFEQLDEVKHALQKIVNSSKGRFSKKNAPWFWEEAVPEDKKIILHELNLRIKNMVMIFNKAMPQVTEVLENISKKLEQKIQARPQENT